MFFKMNLSSQPESPLMTVLNLVLGGTIFTEGGHYSPVNNVLGGQYSLVNNVREDIFGGDTVHYDNCRRLSRDQCSDTRGHAAVSHAPRLLPSLGTRLCSGNYRAIKHQ